MTTFPALVSMPARLCEPGDIVYGRQGSYTGTFVTFKYPITVIEVTDRLYGMNSNQNPFSMDLVGKSDVLIELKGK